MLRNFSILYRLLFRITENNMLKQHLNYFIAICQKRARMEFIDQYNVKIIDWDNKQCKLTHTVPTWRRQKELIPPKPEVICHYAKKLEKNIQLEDLSGNNIKNIFDKHSSGLEIIRGKLVSKFNIRATQTADQPSVTQNSSNNTNKFKQSRKQKWKKKTNNNIPDINTATHSRSNSLVYNNSNLKQNINTTSLNNTTPATSSETFFD